MKELEGTRTKALYAINKLLGCLKCGGPSAQETNAEFEMHDL